MSDYDLERAIELRRQAEAQCERIRGWWRQAVRREGHSWEVVVLASGGWVPLATFANEADAWEYGAKHFDARVYCDGELRAIRRDKGWRGPTPADGQEIAGLPE